MPLAAQSRLGPYEIVAPLGAGGMGEVYRARDTRLGREVAIKVLPQHLSAHPEVRARFEREARTVSSLNHPSICVLHDVGREGDVDYLVLELVEGETLADRLARGPLPIADVLRIGGQIADALDKAHRAGVVHRDLKPGNVMLTKSGAKLMDFGLARATGLAGPISGSGMTLAALTQSPTIAQPLTAEGTIVGTFQYMAPEQLEGKEADARSDLWALGLVLYEMTTGRRAFEGKSQASLIAAILERDPPALTSIVPLAPPALERLVGALMAKDPDQRLQTAHDVKLQLQWIAEGGSQLGVPAPVATRRRFRERLGWGVAVAALLALVNLVALLAMRPRHVEEVTRLSVTASANQIDVSWPRVSPDGKTLAFQATDSTGITRLWVRPLDAFQPHVLAGTDGASRPFWSPDSRFLAYTAGGKLIKVPIAGGPPALVCDAPGRSDGAWGAKGVILLDAGTNDSLLGVPATGGVLRPYTSFDRKAGDAGHTWPSFLPDGEHFLYRATRIAGDRRPQIMLGTLGSKKAYALGPVDSRVEFAPPHYVVYIRDGTLVAQRLDLRGHRLIGEPVPITDQVLAGRNDGEFSSSPAGVLAYTEGAQSDLSELVWMDRGGHRLGVAAPAGRYGDLSLSPDQHRVAVSIGAANTAKDDIWVRDLDRGVTTRLTFTDADDIWPIWSPDGARVLYASDRGGDYRVYAKRASGVGEEDSVASVVNEAAIDWAPNGTVVCTVYGSTTGWDIWVRPDLASPSKPFLNAPYTERDGALSPDGRWLAYRSNETGRGEVYVRSFPGGEGKWQVSTAGGITPTWRADGREIAYMNLDGTIMSVPVEADETFHPGTPVPLFRFVMARGGTPQRRWAMTADGQRFLVNTPVASEKRQAIDLVLNWPVELEKK